MLRECYNSMKQNVKFNDSWFTYYPMSKFSGKSIITGLRWKAGEAIYWCRGVGGFPATEWNPTYNDDADPEPTKEQLASPSICHRGSTTSSSIWHRGSTNKNWTSDDTYSRNRAKQLFKKEFNIDLKDHTGLYMFDKNMDKSIYNIILHTPGQYCEDLFAFDSTDMNKIYFVEVERSSKSEMFATDNSEPILILANKYYKYFDDGNKNHIHYMCFIHEELGKACVIKGTDIKFNLGDVVKIPVGTQYKLFFEVPKKFAKIYDLDNSVKGIMDSCMVTYNG